MWSKVIRQVILEWLKCLCVMIMPITLALQNQLWANSNGLAHTNRFSNNAIKMMDYGSDGMPKVVVIGGPDHKVYYNANDAVDHVAMQQAINSAISVILGNSENIASSLSLNMVPNPASNDALVSFKLSKASEIRIDLFNEKGQALSNIFSGFKEQGSHQIDLSTASLSMAFICFVYNIVKGLKC